VSWVLGATALALAAAAAVVLIAGPGDSGGSGDEQASDESGTLGLTPQGDLPASVHDIPLGTLAEDGPVEGNLHELMDGRPMVVNFFASWCQPCIEEMPAFEQVHQDLGDQVRFVGLAEPPNLEDARELVGQTGVTYPTYADPQGSALAFFEAVNMPTTVFLTADGEVLEMRSRELTEEQLRDKLDEHFGVSSGGSGDGGG
jgi:cytochrome c biogenesis protein CcmG/thiol:disulfide interchange protein DsbE